MAEAERLPFDDEVFDAVLVQCAFCTFPDKTAAAASSRACSSRVATCSWPT